MLNYQILRNLDCFLLHLKIEEITILIGSLFDENTLIKMRSVLFKENEGIDKILKKPKIQDFELKIESSQQGEKDFDDLIFQKNEVLRFLDEEITKIDYILITNINEILCWPYVLKKIKGFKGKIIASEPIIQLSEHFLKEFYSNFNTMQSKFNQGKTDFSKFVNDIDLNLFTENLKRVSFNERTFIYNHLSLMSVSSEYNLGGSMFLIEYFDKKFLIFKDFSCEEFRYPREIDFEFLKGIDYLIQIPNYRMNYDKLTNDFIKDISKRINEYGKEISSLFESINISVAKNDVKSLNYSTFFIVVDPLSLLEMVDFFIYVLQKEIKILYFSKLVKPIIEFANVNHSYLKNKYHNKIYEFEYPFQFDKLFPKTETNSPLDKANLKIESNLLVTNSSLYVYEDLENYVSKSNKPSSRDSPLIYFVNSFSLCYGETKLIYDSFVRNSGSSDFLIFTNDYESDDNIPVSLKKIKFDIDYGFNLRQLDYFLERIKCNNFVFVEENHAEYFEILNKKSIKRQIVKVGEINEIRFDDLFYLNSFISSKTMINKNSETLNFSNINVKFENDKLSFNCGEVAKKEKNIVTEEFELIEKELNTFLHLNKMKVERIIKKEKTIEISILKNNSEFKNLVVLENIGEFSTNAPKIEITTEMIEDTVFLNNFFRCFV